MSQGDKTERNKREKESKRERQAPRNHFFGSDLFERLFPFFLLLLCVRE